MISDYKGVKRALSRWDYEEEAVSVYERALRSALRSAGTRAVLEAAVSAYEAGADPDIKRVLACMDAAAVDCGESPYTMRMLPYLCMLEPAEKRYAAAGLPEAVYTDSFADLLWKTRECRRIYGVYGSFVAPWFYRFFELKCFGLGRLQFEFTSFKCDAPLPCGARVLNVHIPSSGSLDMDECESSYAQAVSFFGLSGEKRAPFVCDSWMLHPYCAELDESSGIRRFAASYELLRVIEDPACSDMWIIFNRVWDGSISALPENTSLQRIFKRHLLAGEAVGRGYGIYLRKS